MKKHLMLIALSMLAVASVLSAAPATEVLIQTEVADPMVVVPSLFTPAWMVSELVAGSDLGLRTLGGTCDQMCQQALHACLQACIGTPGCFSSCQGPYIDCTRACTC